MNLLNLPWLELATIVPLLGALWVRSCRDVHRAQRACVAITAIVLLCAIAALLDFAIPRPVEPGDSWRLTGLISGQPWLTIDELSAPLVPMVALLFLTTAIATLRTKSRRFSFAQCLVSEAILLAILGCHQPWAIIVLMIIATIPPGADLYRRRRPIRVYVLHMSLMAALLVIGQSLVDSQPVGSGLSIAGVTCLMIAVLLRSGVVPVHCWMIDLFENASFGTSLLFVVPMVGAYAAVRLVLPIAPDWVLRSIAVASVLTAFYAAGMALVQTDVRRFFGYLFLSHSSLVLVGLEIATPIGLTGALSVWMSVSLALSGLGLTLRSLEARFGRLSLTHYLGLGNHTPLLATFFLLTGLASVGFPGTFGFVGMELLIQGILDASPYWGLVVVSVAALNGIAVLKTYFRLFAGTDHACTISLECRPSERIAVLTLTLLILIGGVYAQPGIASRYRAATELLQVKSADALPKNSMRDNH